VKRLLGHGETAVSTAVAAAKVAPAVAAAGPAAAEEDVFAFSSQLQELLESDARKRKRGWPPATGREKAGGGKASGVKAGGEKAARESEAPPGLGEPPGASAQQPAASSPPAASAAPPAAMPAAPIPPPAPPPAAPRALPPAPPPILLVPPPHAPHAPHAPLLDVWSLLPDGRVSGRVFGKGGVRDGAKISTARVLLPAGMPRPMPGMTITTATNSRYVLGESTDAA
jgi:hypothetical protein